MNPKPKQARPLLFDSQPASAGATGHVSTGVSAGIPTVCLGRIGSDRKSTMPPIPTGQSAMLRKRVASTFRFFRLSVLPQQLPRLQCTSAYITDDTPGANAPDSSGRDNSHRASAKDQRCFSASRTTRPRKGPHSSRLVGEQECKRKLAAIITRFVLHFNASCHFPGQLALKNGIYISTGIASYTCFANVAIAGMRRALFSENKRYQGALRFARRLRDNPSLPIGPAKSGTRTAHMATRRKAAP
ncbi:protein of unknown function (plasmid) [Caballeronia sp. S22]